MKKSRLNGKIIVQYTVRFSSKRDAEALAKFGIVPKKSLTPNIIGLENDRNFWRGVLDGDGWIGVRNGHDGDKIILTGSYPLLCQFKKFIVKNISGSIVSIRPFGKYSRLYVYSNTARMLARLLFGNCLIALERKLKKAHQMLRGAPEESEH